MLAVFALFFEFGAELPRVQVCVSGFCRVFVGVGGVLVRWGGSMEGGECGRALR